MPEQPDSPMRFVRIKEGGEKEEFTFGQFPAQQQEAPDGPQMVIVPLSDLIGEGGGELRHLAYDDPPHMMTEQEWRQKLQDGAQLADSEAHFVESLTHALAKDLVLSHGCDPGVAIPAIIEFAQKVYAEVNGTV